jgi:hypothetical protein
VDVGSNQELLDSLIDRSDLFELPTSDIALLFANLSRFFSLNDLNVDKFNNFKQHFIKKLVQEPDLSIGDVLALVIPLAAEDLT